MRNIKGRSPQRIFKFVVFGIAAVIVFGVVVMSLWNWLVPAVFGGREITFWQALGLLLLSKILFGGFRGGRPGPGHWRGRMRDRWAEMTPEERERFHDGIHSVKPLDDVKQMF